MSSTTASTPDDEPKGLTCSVCYDAPTQPVVTRCGHLMCWGCLTRWADHELSTGVAAGPKVPCPVCRGGVDPQNPQDVHPILGGAGERTPTWGPGQGASSAPQRQQQQAPPPQAAPRAPPAAARAPEPARGQGFNPFAGGGGGGARQGLGMGIPFFFMFGGFGAGYETALLFLLPLAIIMLQNYAANNAVPLPGQGGIIGMIRRFIGRAPDGSVVGLATIGVFLAFVYMLTTGDLTRSLGMEPSRRGGGGGMDHGRGGAKSAASRHDFGPQVTIV